MNAPNNSNKATINTYPSLRSILTLIAALLLGAAIAPALYSLKTTVLLLLFPCFLYLWPNRIYAFAYTIAFYFSMNAEEISDTLTYFQSNHIQISDAVMVWLCDSFLLSLPWMLIYTKNKKPLNIFTHSILGSIILTLPPLGYFIWGQPLTAAGILFPDLGWWGLSLTILLIALLAALFSTAKPKTKLIYSGTIIALCIFALITNAKYQTPTPPTNWEGLTTKLGILQGTPETFAERDALLTNLVKTQLAQGKKVILLPENISGSWYAGKVAQAEWQQILQTSKIDQASIIYGTQINLANGDFLNVLMLYQNGNSETYPQRQPMPFAMWIPFAKHNSVRNWNLPGKFNVQGKTAAYLICYEQATPWPLLATFVSKPKPQIVLLASNHWYAKHSGVIKELNIMRANARLFGVPYLSAVNYSTNQD